MAAEGKMKRQITTRLEWDLRRYVRGEHTHNERGALICTLGENIVKEDYPQIYIWKVVAEVTNGNGEITIFIRSGLDDKVTKDQLQKLTLPLAKERAFEEIVCENFPSISSAMKLTYRCGDAVACKTTVRCFSKIIDLMGINRLMVKPPLISQTTSVWLREWQAWIPLGVWLHERYF